MGKTLRIGSVTFMNLMNGTESFLCRVIEAEIGTVGGSRMLLRPIQKASLCGKCLDDIQDGMGYVLDQYAVRGAELDHCEVCFKCLPLFDLRIPDSHPISKFVKIKE
jgi:hypothetical protein